MVGYRKEGLEGGVSNDALRREIKEKQHCGGVAIRATPVVFGARLCFAARGSAANLNCSSAQEIWERGSKVLIVYGFARGRVR